MPSLSAVALIVATAASLVIRGPDAETNNGADCSSEAGTCWVRMVTWSRSAWYGQAMSGLPSQTHPHCRVMPSARVSVFDEGSVQATLPVPGKAMSATFAPEISTSLQRKNPPATKNLDGHVGPPDESASSVSPAAGTAGRRLAVSS